MVLNMKVGDRYSTINDGELEIIEYKNSNLVSYRFIDTGFCGITQAGNIRRGTVKDRKRPSVFGVGFVGVGNYKQTTHKYHYNMWKGILERCYSNKYQKRFPSYVGCSVCDEWKDFQAFSLWLDRNLPENKARWEIDKYIKVDGNRIYSPDTCLIVSSQENNEKCRAKHWSLKSPDGEVVDIYNLSKFCKENGINYSNLHAVATGKRLTCKGWKLASTER